MIRSDLKLSTYTHDRWVILEAFGEVHVYTAPRLRQAMIDQVDDGCRLLAVDLSHVEFMDATGLGVLVGGYKRVTALRGRFCIVGCSDKVRSLMENTGLIGVLNVRDGLEDLPATSPA